MKSETMNKALEITYRNLKHLFPEAEFVPSTGRSFLKEIRGERIRFAINDQVRDEEARVDVFELPRLSVGALVEFEPEEGTAGAVSEGLTKGLADRISEHVEAVEGERASRTQLTFFGGIKGKAWQEGELWRAQAMVELGAAAVVGDVGDA